MHGEKLQKYYEVCCLYRPCFLKYWPDPSSTLWHPRASCGLLWLRDMSNLSMSIRRNTRRGSFLWPLSRFMMEINAIFITSLSRVKFPVSSFIFTNCFIEPPLVTAVFLFISLFSLWSIRTLFSCYIPTSCVSFISLATFRFFETVVVWRYLFCCHTGCPLFFIYPIACDFL
jgi:hypothetical protein